jgi:hypothetical protein
MTETKIVDNRVFLLGLDLMYREAMKPQERGELLRCAQIVSKHVRAKPARVPIEGYYGDDPELEEYFRLMRALRSHNADAGSAVDSLAEFRRLHEVCASPIFGEAEDKGKLLPVGRDSLTHALLEVPEWTIPSLVDAASRIARERDDFSLVGLAARAHDEVVLAAVRESTVLYAEQAEMAMMLHAPVPEYLWKVDEEIERAGRKFVDTFNRLFDSVLPVPSADAAEIYWSAHKNNHVNGRRVRIGSDPRTEPIRHYHWFIRFDRFGKLAVEDFWSDQIQTTGPPRPSYKPPSPSFLSQLTQLFGKR